MADVVHRMVQVGDVRLHIAESGSGPLVVLLHGFPEIWYCWRHQFSALAEAGYRPVALDQRGYGRSDRPTTTDSYTIHHLVGDVVGLVHALGEESAIVVGHDWGADVAWHTALMRPDLVRGVIGMGVPYRPRGERSYLAEMRATFGDDFYMNYFQVPGPADTELGADPRRTFRLILRGGRGRTGTRPPAQVVPAGRTFLDGYSDPDHLPDWLSEDDLDVYAAEFAAGFTGGLNWYRNLERNWELTAPLQGQKIVCPSLFIAGEQDRSLNFPTVRDAIRRMEEQAEPRSEVLLLPEVGHWTQQEAPERVNVEIVKFADSLELG